MTTYQKIKYYLFHQNKIVLAISFGWAILSLLAHLETVVRASNGRVIPAIILLGVMTFAFNIPLMLLILRILERIVELIGKWKGYTILLIAFVLEGVIYSGSKVPSSPVVGLFTGAVAMAVLMAIALVFVKGSRPFISENLFTNIASESRSLKSVVSGMKPAIRWWVGAGSVAIAALVAFGFVYLQPSGIKETAEKLPPAPVPVATNQSVITEPVAALSARYEDLHGSKSYAEWSEDDMVSAVNLLANPVTQADRKWLEVSESEIFSEKCSTGSCEIHQQEFVAARKLRDGKAKSAREALGLTAAFAIPAAQIPDSQKASGTSEASRYNWIKYESNKTADSYIDKNTVDADGGITTYRVLQNFHERFSPMLSSISLHEMKCESKQSRFVKASSYSESFGRGSFVGTMTAEMMGSKFVQFSPIEGAQIDHFNVVCKR